MQRLKNARHRAMNHSRSILHTSTTNSRTLFLRLVFACTGMVESYIHRHTCAKQEIDVPNRVSNLTTIRIFMMLLLKHRHQVLPIPKSGKTKNNVYRYKSIIVLIMLFLFISMWLIADPKLLITVAMFNLGLVLCMLIVLVGCFVAFLRGMDEGNTRKTLAPDATQTHDVHRKSNLATTVPIPLPHSVIQRCKEVVQRYELGEGIDDSMVGVLGDRIRTWRIRERLSRSGAAQILGIASERLLMLETGLALPQDFTQAELAQMYECLEELLEDRVAPPTTFYIQPGTIE